MCSSDLFQALMFPLLAATSVVLAVGAVFARMTTQRRWRAWLSGHVVDRWLANGRYYQLNLVPGDHQNPEGRIAEDLRIATDAPVDFCAGVLQAVLSALTFIAVLWSIGGPLSIRVGETWIVVPGFLVIAAVAYSLIASALMVAIGRGFVAASERKNQAEAEYRYVLTRLHENGESFACSAASRRNAQASTVPCARCCGGGGNCARNTCAPRACHRRACWSRR